MNALLLQEGINRLAGLCAWDASKRAVIVVGEDSYEIEACALAAEWVDAWINRMANAFCVAV